MNEAVVWLTIFILSVFVGIEVISKVSSTLHTPLMSGANAIHGVILLGAIIVTGSTDNNVALVVGLVAIVLAAVNMVGGFVVTDRMLQMFVRKKPTARRRPTFRGVTRDPRLGPAALPAWGGLLHPRAQGSLRPQDRPQRQPDRRLRCRPGLHHPVLLRRPRPRAADPGRDRGRHGRRRLRRPHRADDPDAADGGAVQRRRRRCGRAGRAARAARDRRGSAPGHPGVHPRRHRLHDPGRLGVVRRLDRHLRQAPGADDLAAGGLPRPAGRVRWRVRRRDRALGPDGRRARDVARHRARAARPARRRTPGAAGRRRRRTDRHLAAQRVHRPHRRRGRLRALQHAAAGGRHPGRCAPARSSPC